MHKIAKQRGTDGGIDKIEEVRKRGGGAGGWYRGARGLVEVWSKAIPKLQQKCTTRAADNERRALKMQHYVYAVVHRQKSQTTAQNPELSTVSPLLYPPQPSSHSLTRCHCEVSPYPHIRCSTASNEISNVAEIRFFALSHTL